MFCLSSDSWHSSRAGGWIRNKVNSPPMLFGRLEAWRAFEIHIGLPSVELRTQVATCWTRRRLHETPVCVCALDEHMTRATFERTQRAHLYISHWVSLSSWLREPRGQCLCAFVAATEAAEAAEAAKAQQRRRPPRQTHDEDAC